MQVKLVADGLGDDYFFLRQELDELEHDGITALEGRRRRGPAAGSSRPSASRWWGVRCWSRW
ncbi:hypothetical protein ABZU94_18855 [Streptomyces mirabilis]|uniref:hypothetical protein n=1 Tax=Streptomyces sp. NPDC005388 TaxID=3156717 RepID=UPI00339F17A9